MTRGRIGAYGDCREGGAAVRWKVKETRPSEASEVSSDDPREGDESLLGQVGGVSGVADLAAPHASEEPLPALSGEEQQVGGDSGVADLAAPHASEEPVPALSGEEQQALKLRVEDLEKVAARREAAIVKLREELAVVKASTERLRLREGRGVISQAFVLEGTTPELSAIRAHFLEFKAREEHLESRAAERTAEEREWREQLDLQGSQASSASNLMREAEREVVFSKKSQAAQAKRRAKAEARLRAAETRHTIQVDRWRAQLASSLDKAKVATAKAKELTLQLHQPLQGPHGVSRRVSAQQFKMLAAVLSIVIAWLLCVFFQLLA